MVVNTHIKQVKLRLYRHCASRTFGKDGKFIPMEDVLLSPFTAGKLSEKASLLRFSEIAKSHEKKSRRNFSKQTDSRNSEDTINF